MLNGEIWLILAVAAGALILARLWRRAEGRALQGQAENEALAAAGHELEVSLSKQSRTHDRLREELSTLRKKADKARRRQSKAVDRPLGMAVRIRDHEAQVEGLERENRRARSEAEALSLQAARLETRLEESARALEEASAPRPAPPLTPAETALLQTQTELATSREQLAKQAAELEIARQTEARMRRRMNNQEQLYASMRAELEVKKDRLRTQEEQLQRLQALKVAVLD